MASDGSSVGRHWATQLVYAIEFLKKHQHPIRLDELALRSSVDGLLTNPDLLAQFQHHNKVNYDQRTGLYQYKPDFVLRSKTDLMSLLLRGAPRGGLMVKTLREAWGAVGPAIEELEKEGKVLVTRTGASGEKEGQMKAVFLDEIGLDGKVDEEFRSLWSSLRTPIADELKAELDKAGLTASNVIASAPKGGAKGKKGKKAGYRRVKLTNTHLKDQGIDLSKDYVAPGKK